LRTALLVEFILKDIFSFPLLLEQKWSKIQGGTHAIPALLKKLRKPRPGSAESCGSGRIHVYTNRTLSAEAVTTRSMSCLAPRPVFLSFFNSQPAHARGSAVARAPFLADGAAN
jgi:hypothetical protein